MLSNKNFFLLRLYNTGGTALQFGTPRLLLINPYPANVDKMVSS